jgi:hypothetical protein
MNTDDLRDTLADDVRRQPPVTPAFEAGVQRRVRRRRLQTAAVLTPLVALVVVGAALARPTTSPDATLATADATATASAPGSSVVPGTVPVTSVAPTTSAAPATSVVPAPDAPKADDPAVPAPTTTSTVPAPVAGGDCGTVTMTGAPGATPGPDTAPFTCFIRAFNADVAASLSVVGSSPGNGALTSRITTAPGHVMTVATDGTMSIKLPAFPHSGQGGVVAGDETPGSGDCGTITLSTGAKPALDSAVTRCIVSAFMHGTAAQLTVIVNGDLGGAITTSVTLAADHTVTVTSNGTIRVQAPAGLTVPEDVLRAIPAGGSGLEGVPGLSGAGGFGGFGHK